MRCKNCGAQLTAKDGLYYCESCGSKFELSLGYESTDVFIAYIENDEQGRRTKDSTIGQEIYNKLETAKIKTFYQRISASDISGDTAELISDTAFDASKVVIFLGATPQNFTRLLEKYRNKLGRKTVCPIYADMDAYDIPSELKGVQALNYSSVGAISDLPKNLLKLLGREAEIDIIDEAEVNRKKRKKKVLISVVCILLAIIGVCAYIVFGTTYVLPSKKYDCAQTLMEKEKYSEAIIMLNKIPDYKNSDRLLNEAYNKYVGYYQNDEESIGLHITVSGNLSASIEITRQDANSGTIKIIENAEILSNTIFLDFNDSENNQGSAFIELTNEGIDLSLDMESGNELKVFFNIDDKSDQPIVKGINADAIKGWLKTTTTEQNIKSLGYELVFEHALYKDTSASQYSIANTEIKVALFDYDISKTDGSFGGDEVSLNSKTAFGFSAPAKTLIPDKIGQNTLPYVEDDILYLPNALMEQAYKQLDFYIGVIEDAETITEDMLVSCTSKALLSEEHWNSLLEEYVYGVRIEDYAVAEYGDKIDTIFGTRVEADNKTHYLFSVRLWDSTTTLLYRINKSNFNIEYIDSSYYDSYENEVFWQMYPELVDEFPNDFDLRY